MTSLLIAGASIKDTLLTLDWVPSIYYLLCFWKDTAGVKALIDCGSEVNAMTSVYISKLSLKTPHTNVRGQKIDSSTLKTFGMILASFQIEDKLGRSQYF